MDNNRTMKPFSLHRSLLRLRWLAPVIVLFLAALHQVGVRALQSVASSQLHDLLAIGLYSLTGIVVVWIGLTVLAQVAARREQAEAQLQAAYENLERTHQQLLVVHDIGRQVAMADDEQQVLELAARAPVHLTEAQGSTVIGFDDEGKRLRLEMAWGLSESYVQALRQRLDEGVPMHRCHSCAPLAANVASDCPLFEGMQERAKTEGIESLLCLPISREQERIGIISAYFPMAGGPPQDQVRLLNIVATEIAATLQAVRLRAQHMAAVYAVDRLTEMRQDMNVLLDRVLEMTMAGWRAEAGAILLYEPMGGIWHSQVQRGLGHDPADARLALAIRLSEEARQAGGPILIPDLAQYDVDEASMLGLSSAAVTALVAESETLGVLFLGSTHRSRIHPRQTSFLAAIAHQAALALRNAQLHQQVQRMAVLEERYRLSREMHDGLAQTLGSLGWQLDHLKSTLSKGQVEALAEGLDTARRSVRDAYIDVREAIDGLRLTIEHPGGLAAALEEYAIDFEARSGIATHLEVQDECPLPAEMALQLLRIAQEALTNLRKHAEAQNAWIQLSRSASSVELTIADDGRGFDSSLPQGRQHLGLSTMRERAQSLGGGFTLVTSPHQGTRLTITVPHPI